MSTFTLYPHQTRAIDSVLASDFESSVIHYATGTGKSLIGYELVSEYHRKYPTQNILWICEYKNALNQQFSNGKYKFPKSLKIVNCVQNKSPDWIDSANSTYKIWKYTQLIVINRAYLTSYQKLMIPIGLVIHDECHTASNNSSQLFYKWLLEYSRNTKCIGLSATPNWAYPFNKLRIKYDMIDALKDGVICKPTIYTLCDTHCSTLFEVICELLNREHSNNKLVLWCGTIANCEKMFDEWLAYADANPCWKSVHTYQDHSRNSNQNVVNMFNNARNNAFLFCANKNREASDFQYLDGCVFLDGVIEREQKLFVQCLGRVLRKSENKTCGWIFDAYASNVVECCDRLLKYTNKSDDWHIVSQKIRVANVELMNISVDIEATQVPKSVSVATLNASNIRQYFVRTYPQTPEYINRINTEIALLDSKCVFPYIDYAMRIQQLSKDTIYITRGSCGSSLICYLLGLSHVDPVKYNIFFERFMHNKRDTLPDIDFDFPYYKRDKIFMEMHNKWGSEMSRISSNINWKERSAVREGIRMLGFTKQMNNKELKVCISSLSSTQKNQLESYKQELLDTHRTTMKHVGGVVFGYNNNLNTDNLINVTTDDKHDISRNKSFKIDILSSRSLAIIHECCPLFTNADFNNIGDNPLLYEQIFHKGNNMGLVLAESVLMKRAFIRYKPTNIEELAWCFAIVRPMAKVARDSDTTTFNSNSIVFDDDVLIYISNIMRVDIGEADCIRRKMSKGDADTIETFLKQIVANYPNNNRDQLIAHMEKHVDIIARLTEYGFCKSHSVSYAMMIWHMANIKFTNPALYWKSCLEHADSSYAKWVHLSEAVHAGVDISPYIYANQHNPSVYSQIRTQHNMEIMAAKSERQQLLEHGYWLGLVEGIYYDGCYLEKIADTNVYRFRGILAAIRTPESYKYLKQTGLYLGVGFQKYLDIIVKNMTHFDTTIYVGVEGLCTLHNDVEQIYESTSFKLF